MNIISTELQQPSATFIKNTKTTGIIMIVIGVVGILLPNFLSFTLNAFVGGLFLLAAIALSFNVVLMKTKKLTQWIKPLVLFVLAIIVLLHPAIVLSVLGLMLAVYFILSGFSNIVLSFDFQPGKARWFMLFNGILSFILGIVVVDSWPFSAAWIVGLIMGVSFLLDGIALISFSKVIANKLADQPPQEKEINPVN